VTVKLDTRPARAFTSRECAIVLGSLVSPMARIWGIQMARAAVTYVAKIFDGQDATEIDARWRPKDSAPKNNWSEAVTLLSGLYTGLATHSEGSAAGDAFRWWSESETMWDVMKPALPVPPEKPS
jgi:hypothetical protein